MDKKFDLGFGDSFLVRELCFERCQFDFDSFFFSKKCMQYENEELKKEIVSHARKILKQFMGIEDEFVGICHGATGGLTSALRVLRASEVRYGKHHFPFYKNIAKIAATAKDGEIVKIIDSPSNPEGLLSKEIVFPGNLVIFDGAYHNPIYLPKTKGMCVPTSYKFAIGSFGKLLGLNGLRLGFYSTSSPWLAEDMEEKIVSETLGVSTSSMSVLNQVLAGLDLEDFTTTAGERMNDNREEMARIERYFDGDVVPDTGMFYFAKASKKTLELLNRAGIKYIDGAKCGSTEGHVRLSLGQTREITLRAVSEIIKIDGG